MDDGRKIKRCGPVLAVMLFLLAPLTGAGVAAAMDAPEQPVRDIVFATDWKAQAEHGGFYQALATGLYKKYGLNVRIRMGGAQINIQQLIAAGAIDFGMASNNFHPLNMLEAGADAKVVMASFQKDPQMLMTHPRDDVSSIADMAGKPIMIADGAVSTLWVWLKARFGFSDSQIRKYTFNLAPWLVSAEAIQEGYVSSEPFLARQQGIEPEVYLLADAGYPGYSAMILVGGERLRATPEDVQDFVNATIEGWYSYLYGDPGPGNALIKADNPEMSDALLTFARAKLLEFAIVDSGDALSLGIGAMTDERWRAFIDVMVAEGVYAESLNFTAAYTSRFVNQGHGLDLKARLQAKNPLQAAEKNGNGDGDGDGNGND